jgi:Holliday junction resolvase RusA-like endonuclease
MNRPTKSILFNILHDPEGAARPRFDFRRKVAYTPTGYRKYKSIIQSAIRRQLGDDFQVLDQPVSVEIMFHMKRPKSVTRDLPSVKPDLDNLLKAILDGMNGIVWRDDALVCEIVTRKIYSDGPHGYTEVQVFY